MQTKNTTTMVATADGSCRTYVAEPDATGKWPAVIVLMDAPGFRPALCRIADRIAADGYAVAVPDLYYRVDVYEPIVAREVMTDPARRAVWWEKYFTTIRQSDVMRDVE